MQARLPSIKTLGAVFGNKAREARAILEMTRAQLEALPAGAARARECLHPPKTYDLRMSCLDALGASYGVESFLTSRAGWCVFLNTGDTYAPTLVRFNSRYRVASWGDIAERHGAQ